MKKNKVEVLAPAGSYESLKAAIAAGADAVYLGGIKFGARAYANNLSTEQLKEAIDFVHLHNRKIYLTINTLLKETEITEELYDYLNPLYRHGLDAVIVQDTGVIAFIKKYFPDLAIHASTQMTITNLLGAKFLESIGVERVVTARELSVEEIKEISTHTNLEVESFVHGALCYSYSGQCLFSSLIGGRSGNRGQCAQPCRLPYETDKTQGKSYLLSLKDICTLDYLPQIISAGIYSLKIEGRMKSPEYVAAVTSMYRKYVDLYLKKGCPGYFVEEKDKEMLLDIYNRGGFHGGYYTTKNGPEMLSIKKPNHAGIKAIKVDCIKNGKVLGKALVDLHKGDIIELTNPKGNYTLGENVKVNNEIKLSVAKNQKINSHDILYRTKNEQLQKYLYDTIITKKTQEKINGILILHKGESAKLELSCQNITITAYGDIVEEAISHAMDSARIEKQMKKTGNTEFIFNDLKIISADSIFISLQKLNELRRHGLEILEKAIYLQYRREPATQQVSKQNYARAKSNDICKNMAAYVETKEQLETVMSCSDICKIYVDCNIISKSLTDGRMKKFVDKCHSNNQEIYYAMPQIFRKDAVTLFDANYNFLLETGYDGILVRNIESFEFLKEHLYSKDIILDHNIYIFNSFSQKFWCEEGITHSTAPLELNYHELQQLDLRDSDLIAYGYLPMMISAQCIQKNTQGCSKQLSAILLKDRYQKEFLVKNYCDYCYNVIYNILPLNLCDQKKEIQQIQPNILRLHFTIENAYETKRILKLFGDTYVRNYALKKVETDFTRGHFKRGIK
ncbi:MAG: DUF3656 domain-containing protein [Lachnospiraceae bacterium]|nr:DUF3656 domain-containing protein [Lachnospiraceae bacterium]